MHVRPLVTARSPILHRPSHTSHNLQWTPLHYHVLGSSQPSLTCFLRSCRHAHRRHLAIFMWVVDYPDRLELLAPACRVSIIRGFTRFAARTLTKVFFPIHSYVRSLQTPDTSQCHCLRIFRLTVLSLLRSTCGAGSGGRGMNPLRRRAVATC